MNSTMDADDWDARYADKDLVWGLTPNRWVEQELATAKAGSALDLGCGEGRNALWLAGLGWDVTAVDFAPVAISKARQLAEGRRPVVWIVDDVLDYRPGEPFDLVLLCYLQLRPDERRRALQVAAGAVAPGGQLLVIAHDSANLQNGTGGPKDPDVLYTAEDVRADLTSGAGADLVVTRAEAVYRPVEGAPRPAIDCLLTARRAPA